MRVIQLSQIEIKYKFEPLMTTYHKIMKHLCVRVGEALKQCSGELGGFLLRLYQGKILGCQLASCKVCILTHILSFQDRIIFFNSTTFQLFYYPTQSQNSFITFQQKFLSSDKSPKEVLVFYLPLYFQICLNLVKESFA